MWLAPLLVTLTACQVVFPLDEGQSDQIERVAISAQSFSPSPTIVVDRDEELADGDQIVVVIQGTDGDNVEMTDQPDGWVVGVNTGADNCTGNFHVWFVTATLAGEPSFDFAFQFGSSPFPPLPNGFDVLVTGYRNASKIRRLDDRIVIHDSTMPDAVAVFPSGPAPAGSILWLGTAGTRRLTVPPTNVDATSETNNIAVFDVATLDAVPEVTVTPPVDDTLPGIRSCTVAGRVVLEP